MPNSELADVAGDASDCADRCCRTGGREHRTRAAVITAKTTPYSAMVCPSSRDCSEAKSFCTCFTSLLVLGRQGGADDDSDRRRRRSSLAVVEPLSCWANAQIAHAELPLVRASAWPRRRWAQLAESSCVGGLAVIPRLGDCWVAFPRSGDGRRPAPPDEWVTFRCGRGTQWRSAPMWRPRRSTRDGSTAHATTEVSLVEPDHPLRLAVAGRRLPGGPATRAGARGVCKTLADAAPAFAGAVSLSFATLVLRGRGLLGRRGRLVVGFVEGRHTAAGRAAATAPRCGELAPGRLGRRGLDRRLRTARPPPKRPRLRLTPAPRPRRRPSGRSGRGRRGRRGARTASPEAAAPSTSRSDREALPSRRDVAVAATRSESSRTGVTPQRRSARRGAGTADPAPAVIEAQSAEPDAQARSASPTRRSSAGHSGDDLAPPGDARSDPGLEAAHEARSPGTFATRRHKHSVNWSLVLGVLRARGERGSVAATKRGLNRLAKNLSRLGARKDSGTRPGARGPHGLRRPDGRPRPLPPRRRPEGPRPRAPVGAADAGEAAAEGQARLDVSGGRARHPLRARSTSA